MNQTIEKSRTRAPERTTQALHWIRHDETVALCGLVITHPKMPPAAVRALGLGRCPLCDALGRLINLH